MEQILINLVAEVLRGVGAGLHRRLLIWHTEVIETTVAQPIEQGLKSSRFHVEDLARERKVARRAKFCDHSRSREF